MRWFRGDGVMRWFRGDGGWDGLEGDVWLDGLDGIHVFYVYMKSKMTTTYKLTLSFK
jgi:hypothetical protein